MDESLKKLMVLLEKKIENPDSILDTVKKQLSIIQELEEREKLESKIYCDLIEKIKNLEYYEEFNFSKKQFAKISGDKTTENDVAKIFSSEIESVFSAIHNLKGILESQRRSGRLVFYDERQLYQRVDEKLERINNMEGTIKTYFLDLKNFSKN